MEDTATNNIIYSGLSTTSNWATDFLGTTTEVSGLTGPFDTATLFEVTGTGAEAGRIYYNGAPNGGNFQVGDTVSVFVKLDTDPTGTSTIMFRSGTQGSQAKFTIATETTTVEGSAWENLSFQKLSGGWYRFSADWIDASASNSPRIWISDTTSVVVTSSGTKMYVKGFQSENSSYPTSYIPTTSDISTRAADISSSSTSTRGEDNAKIIGAGFSSFYNTSESTWYAEGDQTLINSNGNQEGVNSLFVDRYSDISTQRWREDQWRGMQGSTDIILPYITPTTPKGDKVKTVYAIDGTNARMCVEGVLSNSVSLGAYPGVTELRIGESARLLVNDKWRGHISRLTYWPRRLPDSDLQRLTE